VRGETDEHPGYLGAQDTYYVGNIKGVGHIYQQTFIDTYTKVAFCKLYDRKNALAAADALNIGGDPVLRLARHPASACAYGQGQRILRKQGASRIRAVP